MAVPGSDSKSVTWPNQTEAMADWIREITELHDFFDDVFNARRSGVDRLQAALADDFTLVGPDGNVMDHATTIAAIDNAHGARMGLRVSTAEHQLLFELDGTLVASYVEVHTTDDSETRRLTTVVFTTDVDAPNGLVWRRVHETWLSD